MMQNCYEFDNSNYSSSTTTKDENEQNEPELEALERSSSTSKDLHQHDFSIVNTLNQIKHIRK